MGKVVPATSRHSKGSGERLQEAFASARSDLVQSLARVLGSSEDAQDVVQDAFLKCWRSRDTLHRVRDLRAWIFRVGLNAARDHQRKGWRRRARPLPTQLDLCARSGLSPSEEVLEGEDLERLRLALSRLRAEEQEVFLLRQNSDLTYEEIARRCHIPSGTAKTLMRSALHKLQVVLQDRA
jgi:RNA polymerase sigma-70 factor (ECF subfamily)